MLMLSEVMLDHGLTAQARHRTKIALAVEMTIDGVLMAAKRAPLQLMGAVVHPLVTGHVEEVLFVGRDRLQRPWIARRWAEKALAAP